MLGQSAGGRALLPPPPTSAIQKAPRRVELENPHDHAAATCARRRPSGRRRGVNGGRAYHANSRRAPTPALPVAAHPRGQPASTVWRLSAAGSHQRWHSPAVSSGDGPRGEWAGQTATLARALTSPSRPRRPLWMPTWSTTSPRARPVDANGADFRPLWMPRWSMTAAACLFVQHGAACGSASVADMDYGAARRTRGADEAPLSIEQLRGDFAGLPLMWFCRPLRDPCGMRTWHHGRSRDRPMATSSKRRLIKGSVLPDYLSETF